MFGSIFSRAPATATAIETSPADLAPPPEPDMSADAGRIAAVREKAEDVLARWHSLGETQRRAFEAVCAEIAGASTEVEDSVLTLIRSFDGLTVGAQAQTRQLEQTLLLVDTIETGGKSVGIGEFVQFIEQALTDMVERMLQISKTAMAMVYSLDDVATNLATAEACVGDIAHVNHRTRMLSFNASIEAARAGPAGRTFTVVAAEVRDLSHSTETLAQTMQTEISVISRALAASRELLAEVATVDLTSSLDTKAQLDAMLIGLQQRRQSMAGLMRDMTECSASINAHVDAIATEVQFQDRNRKRMTDLMQTLRVLAETTQQVQTSSTAWLGPGPDAAPDERGIERILDACEMDDVRRRFAAWLRTGAAATNDAPGNATTIDLF